MFELYSHVLAFLVLSLGAVWDLKTTEVPDTLGWIGVGGGIVLHGLSAYMTGSVEPLVYCLAVGAAFSVFGWGSYLAGMWGGADAFAMSVLGFAAPYAVTGFSVLFPVNLFVNVMLVGFIYTLGFAIWKAMGSGTVLEDTWTRIIENEKRVALELVLAGFFSAVMVYAGSNGLFMFFSLVFMIFLYRFLKVLENKEMIREVKVSELEGGEVAARGQGLGNKVKGLTKEDINSLDCETVEIKSGVRFIPAFPVALLITELFPVGVLWLLVSL